MCYKTFMMTTYKVSSLLGHNRFHFSFLILCIFQHEAYMVMSNSKARLCNLAFSWSFLKTQLNALEVIWQAMLASSRVVRGEADGLGALGKATW